MPSSRLHRSGSGPVPRLRPHRQTNGLRRCPGSASAGASLRRVYPRRTVPNSRFRVNLVTRRVKCSTLGEAGMPLDEFGEAAGRSSERGDDPNRGGDSGDRDRPRQEITRQVDAAITADAMGNTGVAVLATPILVGLFEQAAATALLPHLEPGQASVGTHVDIRHLAADADRRHRPDCRRGHRGRPSSGHVSGRGLRQHRKDRRGHPRALRRRPRPFLGPDPPEGPRPTIATARRRLRAPRRSEATCERRDR